MADSETRPLEIVAKEFGYKNSNSLQVVMTQAGYTGGWDNLPALRAAVKKRKDAINARIAARIDKAERKAARKSAHKAERVTHTTKRNPELDTLAQELFPTLTDRAYARKRVRDKLKAAKYRGALTNLEKMRAALGAEPVATTALVPQEQDPQAVIVEGGPAQPVQLPAEATRAIKLVVAIKHLLEQHEHDYHALPRRQGCPFCGLSMYMLGMVRGTVPLPRG